MGWLPCEERAGEGLKGDQGVRGTGQANPKHGLHGGDAGRVEAQRLVELRRALPSRKEGIQSVGARSRGSCRSMSNQAGEAWIEVGAEARTEHT